MQTPLVSIIIPIYNVAPYLKECLDSIISQSYENLDIILVDDGSSDGSLDIALDFARQDKRIFVISKPNGGLSSARNFGLECIKGSALRGFFENRACHTEALAEVSHNRESRDISLTLNMTNNRDSSVASLHQNDKKHSAQYDNGFYLVGQSETSHLTPQKQKYFANAQYDKISLTQNQIAHSKYPAFVYIITNKNHTTLYIGVTSNLQKRIYEHKNHLAKGFSDKYNCEKLVYFESFDSIEQAIEREKYLKDKKREFKEKLVDSINPQWLDLYEYLFGTYCHTEGVARSISMSDNRDSSLRAMHFAQNDNEKTTQNDKESTYRPTSRSEVSQNNINSRDISHSLNMTKSTDSSVATQPQNDNEKTTQYDKNKDITSLTQNHNFETTIQSLAQTHTFTKTYKTITKQEIDAHFTQIAPHFIKSDLERINDFITQELPKDALIHFVDSDDTITNDCIQKCVARLLKWDLDIAVHNWLEYDDTTKQSTKGAYLSNLKQNEYNTGLELLTQNKIYDFYFSPQGLFRAEILNRYALRYTEGIYHEDHDFGTLLFCLACKVAYANEGLYIYRKRATSIINVQKQAAFPAQIPSFLEPLRGDFSDYKSLREYFRAYCFVRLGFIIWEFYEAQLSQNGGQKLDFRARYEGFFSSVILGYAMKVFKTPLSKDTLGIQSMLATLKFPKISVWWHFVKDLHRQPKKLAHITNIRYLL